jgi:hypothetical protein
MELLPYRIDRHAPNEYGRTYIDIFIMDGTTDRSIMTVYLEQVKRKNFRPLDKINISYVEKYDTGLKRCFREYMKILVSKSAEIFGRELEKSAEVVLIVSPQMPALIEESFAIEELKKLYGKSGFKNYDPNNQLFMVSTINNLKKVLEGKDKLDDPYRTPNESIDYGSPTTPEKENNGASISQNEPLPLRYTKEIPGYLKTTESSRRKTRNKRTPQVHQSKGGKRTPQVHQSKGGKRTPQVNQSKGGKRTPQVHQSKGGKRRCTKRKTIKKR